MKKKIKYLSVILAFVIMVVNTLPGTPVKVNASDLESVSENSIAEVLSETATTPTESSDGTEGTVTPPTESGNETGKWSAEISYYLSDDLIEENLWQKVVKEPEIVSEEYSPSIYTQILAETPIKAGCVFCGWMYKEAVEDEKANYAPGEDIAIDKDRSIVTMVAQWKELPKVTIRYIDVEGEVTKDISGDYIYTNDDGTMSAYSVNCTVAKDYYKFAGWVCDIDETATLYQNGDLLENISLEKYIGETITFIAQWEALPSVAIEYVKYDGSKVEGEPIQQKAEPEEGETFTVKLLTDDSEYAGHEFIGWKYKINDGVYSEEIYAVNSAAPTFKWQDFANGGTITFEAQWIELAKVTVNFMNGTTTYQSVPIQKEVGKDNFQVTMPEKSPEQAGYRFVGWNCDIDGKTYTVEQIPTFVWTDVKDVSEITFTAVWEKLPSVEIHFIGGMEDYSETFWQEDTDTLVVNLPSDLPVRDYHEFTGWVCDTNGGIYKVGTETVDFSWEELKKMETPVVTFTAQWQWNNESIFETATYSLIAGNPYYLTDGTWTVNDDGYSYVGNITFSVREDGDYTFKKN